MSDTGAPTATAPAQTPSPAHMAQRTPRTPVEVTGAQSLPFVSRASHSSTTATRGSSGSAGTVRGSTYQA